MQVLISKRKRELLLWCLICAMAPFQQGIKGDICVWGGLNVSRAHNYDKCLLPTIAERENHYRRICRGILSFFHRCVC